MATYVQFQNRTPTTISLAKRGDVILVLGKGEDAAAKLLVSSNILRTASVVLEKMFDGRFAEGKALSVTNPHEVQLPDDNPACMSMLCHIIHLQTADVPRPLDVATLADFAILCDKYDCIDAVWPRSRVWVLELLSKPDTMGYEKITHGYVCARLAREVQQGDPQPHSFPNILGGYRYCSAWNRLPSPIRIFTSPIETNALSYPSNIHDKRTHPGKRP
ncbi:hypothetical protein K458DRAFT_151766 [Lentithecium fluviatile CBS 122367]|uniref:BTB domain-containing protein n=1 Tax=Lentithecium fluviatile CBS 122367 TaxID=1168545 RepID=A0A6G1JES6_9PLEO|nr:hypothetical protein K458DRAFT_151766 [Lentithecium fluviatile CBS 122367]